MTSKLSILQSGLLAIYISIPFFRPILIAHHRILPVYILFGLAFFILLLNTKKTVVLSNHKLTIFLLSYTIISIIVSLFGTTELQIDHIGLLCFLPISYFLGLWQGKYGSAHTFFRIMALTFIPIAIYVLYQLSKSSFSYNTYMYWSKAAYKIDYLTMSMFAAILMIYFFFKGRNFIEKYGLSLFFLGFIAISGARYSIIFSSLALIFVTFRSAKKSPLKLTFGLLSGLILMISVLLFDKSLLTDRSDLISHSSFRIESIFGKDNSLKGRQVLIQKSSEIISEHFFTGVGVGGASNALHSNYPHNLLLEAFIDGGIFAVLPLLIFLLLSMYQLISSRHEDKVWLMLLVLYLLGGFLKSFSIYESRILFFFIGYAMVLKSERPATKNRPLLNLNKNKLLRQGPLRSGQSI